MALTDEQYQQIFRYADNEMNATESEKFEASLIENKELRDEVELYKQIRLLSESVEQKTSNIQTSFSEEKKSGNKEIKAMLAEARNKWENEYEDELKIKYGITESINIPGREKHKIRRIKISSWLVAASFIVLISLAILWWNNRDKNDDSKAAINNKKTDSAFVTERQTKDTVGNIIQIQPTPPTETASSKNIAERKENKKLIALFADNFKPDSVPADKEGPLETALAFYENEQYEKASREFENVDIGPVTRGAETDIQKLTTFYLPYYKALSYMAGNVNNSKVITELKKAIATSPDKLSKIRAQWYLALAYLKNGDIEASQVLLKQVAVSNESKELKQKAITLSKALNEN